MKNIMKTAAIMLLLSSGSIAYAQNGPSNQGEVGYSEGALGYDAMVAGDYRKAAVQIEANDRIAADDPARLINLGQAYAKMGRHAEARAMLETAANSRKHFDLVLANGAIMNSRDVARIVLVNMENRFAAR